MKEWMKKQNTVDFKDGTSAACDSTAMSRENVFLSKTIEGMIAEIS